MTFRAAMLSLVIFVTVSPSRARDRDWRPATFLGFNSSDQVVKEEALKQGSEDGTRNNLLSESFSG